MKYFIPHSENASEAEQVLESIKKFVKMTIGFNTTDRRIYSIHFHHNGKDYFAEVGKPEPQINEEVIAILESNTFLICTPNRRVIRGMPILVGKEEVYSIEDFENESTL